ncbi:GntR family transcriptional regulator [Devosia sp.]|uniref:GntR family transcriptional regulator n=1 Tax=Devosia sp. TaxID=1871048 RepID=UPI003266CC22
MNVQPQIPKADGSATDLVERGLRKAIIELELGPGSKLSEQEIANRLGVSRQPVREALIRLANSRLIEIRPNRGTVVVRISAKEMTEALFVRLSVELAVVERAVENFDPWQRKRIDALIGKQKEAANALDHAAFREHDEAFHIALAQGAGVGIAWIAIADMKSHMDRVCNLTLQTESDMLRRVKEHRAIMEAIDNGERKSARKAMTAHLESILDAMPALEASYPHLFG